jgi:hypothetical protein
MSKTSHRFTVLLGISLPALTLPLPACVLQTDFGDTEDTDGTPTDGATSDASDASDAADGSESDTEPALPPGVPALAWTLALEHEYEYERDSYYLGVSLGPAGGILAAGGWWSQDAAAGGAFVHRYTPDGSRTMEADVPASTAVRFTDACLTPEGSIFAVSLDVAHPTDPGDSVVGLVELSPTGDVVGVLDGAVSSDDVVPHFTRLACAADGRAWLVAGWYVEGARLLGYDSGGLVVDEWLGYGDADLRLDDDTLYLAFRDPTEELTRWQRRDLDGVLVDERTSPLRPRGFAVRGDRMAGIGSEGVVVTDLDGNEQWQVDQIDGQGLDVLCMGLGDQGQLAVVYAPSSPMEDPGNARLALLGPDGATLFVEALPPQHPPQLNPEVYALELAVDHDGAIVLVGGEVVSGKERARITRYELQ